MIKKQFISKCAKCGNTEWKGVVCAKLRGQRGYKLKCDGCGRLGPIALIEWDGEEKALIEVRKAWNKKNRKKIKNKKEVKKKYIGRAVRRKEG